MDQTIRPNIEVVNYRLKCSISPHFEKQGLQTTWKALNGSFRPNLTLQVAHLALGVPDLTRFPTGTFSYPGSKRSLPIHCTFSLAGKEKAPGNPGGYGTLWSCATRFLETATEVAGDEG